MATSPYTEEQKREAVKAVLLHGGFRPAGRVTGIHWETIAGWKHRDPEWWHRVASEVTLELLQGLTESSVHKALGLKEQILDLMKDRLENGEHKFNVKTGELVRVPVSVSDMTKAFAALGGNKSEPKAPAMISEEERLAELTAIAEEDRASRPN
jgi:hypothetical protein